MYLYKPADSLQSILRAVLREGATLHLGRRPRLRWPDMREVPVYRAMVRAGIEARVFSRRPGGGPLIVRRRAAEARYTNKLLFDVLWSASAQDEDDWQGWPKEGVELAERRGLLEDGTLTERGAKVAARRRSRNIKWAHDNECCGTKGARHKMDCERGAELHRQAVDLVAARGWPFRYALHVVRKLDRRSSPGEWERKDRGMLRRRNRRIYAEHLMSRLQRGEKLNKGERLEVEHMRPWIERRLRWYRINYGGRPQPETSYPVTADRRSVWSHELAEEDDGLPF